MTSPSARKPDTLRGTAPSGGNGPARPTLEDSTLVAELGRRALTQTNIAIVMEDACRLVSERLGTEFVKILELVPTGEGFLLVSGVGWKPGYVGQVVVPLIPESHAGYTMQHGRPIIVEDLRTEERFRGMPLLHEHGIVSGLSVILHGAERPHGIMTAHSAQKRKFTETDVAFMESVASVVGAAFDRRDTEKALAESDERLRLAMAAGRMGTWEWSPHTGEVVWSESLEMIHGLKPGSFGGTFEDYAADIHPDDRERVLATIQESMESGTHELEYRIVRPDGSLHWLTARGILLRDSRGEPDRMIGICIDITEQKKAEEGLREAEEKYRTIFENATFGVFQTTRDGRFISANQALAQMLGYESPQEMVQAVQSIGEEVHTDPGRRAEFARILESEGRVAGFESLARRKDGELLWISLTARARHDDAGNVVNYEGIVENITQRKQAESRVAAQYRVTRVLAESATAVEAVPLVLKALAEELDWAIAGLWTVDREQAHLEWAGVHISGVNAQAFEEQSRGMQFARGEGLPGRVWDAAQPAWILDVTKDANFPRAKTARGAGLKSGFAFPLVLAGQVIGVLEMFTTRVRHRDDELVGTMESLGSQLGQFIERKRAEQELARTTNNLDDFFRNAAVGLHWVDAEGTILRANRAELEMLGYTEEEYLGHNIAEFHADQPVIEEILQRLLAGETLQDYPARLVAKDGSIRHVLISTNGLFENGQFVHSRCMTQDVTERVHAEAEREQLLAQLQAAETRYRSLFSGVRDAILVTDAESQFLDANPEAFEMLGYTREELMTMRVGDITARGPDWADGEYAAFLEHGTWHGELELRRKNGTLVQVEARASIVDLPGEKLHVSVVRDITERKRTEQELQRLVMQLELSRQRVDNLVSNVPGVVWEAWGEPSAEDQRIDFVSDHVQEMTGYAPEEWTSTPNFWLSIVHPDDRERAQAEASAIFESGTGGTSEFRWVTRDGRAIWVEAQSTVIRDASGRPIGMRGVTMDITERRLNEAKVRESEERFSKAFHASPAGLTITRASDRVILDANESFLSMLGFPRDEVIGRTAMDVRIWPDEWEQERLRAALEAGGGRAVNLELSLQSREGELRSVLGSAEVITLGGEQCVLALMYDITERKEAEAREALLAEASTILASSLDYEATLRQVARLTVGGTADICSIDMVRGASLQRVALAHEDAEKEAAFIAMPPLTTPANPDSHPVMRVARSRKPELHARLNEEELASAARDEEHLSLLRQLGICSALIVPLVAGGRALGALTLARTRPNRPFNEDDLELAEELARRAGLAIDNSFRYEAEQAARREAEESAERTATLQEITAALSEALTPSRVAEVVIESGIRTMGGSAGAVCLLAPDGEALEVIASMAYHPETMQVWQRIPVASNTPAATVLHTGLPIFRSDMADLIREFPDMAAAAKMGYRSAAIVPLVVEGRPTGAMALSFMESREFEDDDREFLQALARLCAQALERARLFEAEREARAEAQAAEQRQAFLAEASAILSSSLDYEETLASVARLCVPYLGDWCAIDVVEDEQLTRVAVVHSDPDKLDFARRFQEQYPPDINAPSGVGQVIREGKAQFAPDVTDEMLAAAARDEGHLELMRQLGIRSGMTVPMKARGRTLGVILLIMAESGRKVTEADLALAEDLAHRAGLAVDNARLYSQSQAVQEELRIANEAKDEFLGLVSHELRTPITTIFGGARLLRSRGDHLDVESRGSVLSDIEHEAERLHRIVEDLLVLARVELGQEVITEPVLVQRVTEKTVVDFNKRRPARKLVTSMAAELPTVRASTVYLEQILRNLINNADKYSPPNLPIDVTAELRDGDVVVSVMDRGPGIPPEEMEMIFERFYRSSGTAKTAGGAGIGLTVCKRLLEAQEGRIWAEAREGGGLVMSFALPVYTEAPPGS